jgi:tetratricopeptide (TPR) repeat protein
MSSTATIGVLIAALSLGPVFQANAQHDHASASGEVLGKVDFRTSCNPDVRAEFNRATALLHSFEFSRAIEAYSSVLKKDPSCAVAHWGIVLSQWSNPFGGVRPPLVIERGQEAVARARAWTGGKMDARERAYFDAAALLFDGAPKVPQRDRTLAYERAMEKIVADHPDDMEAKIFYALAVNQTALPTDKTYANQLKATGILEPLYRDHPDHPGLAHYIIHAYDHPPLASRAIDAARRYAKIAPSAPHALHMPSHTFTRVGYWQDSIASNIASAESATKLGTYGEVLHAMDYQIYAYLQLGQDAAARGVLDRLPDVLAKFNPDAIGGAAGGSAGLYALAAIPARYALERGAWADAASLEPRTTAYAWVDSATPFARALGAARSGSPAAAVAEIARLKTLHEKLGAASDADWAARVDVQRRIAEAWVAFAEGRRDEAITALRGAADAEDATDKSAVSPGPLAPAREMLGEMLLEAGQPKDALAAFEATMQKEPNRFRAVAGAMRAAEAAGDRTTAAKHASELLEIAKTADSSRPDLGRARQLAGKT